MDDRTTKCFNCDGSQTCYYEKCPTYAASKKEIQIGLNPTCAYYHVINSDLNKIIRYKQGKSLKTDLTSEGKPCLTFDIGELL